MEWSKKASQEGTVGLSPQGQPSSTHVRSMPYAAVPGVLNRGRSSEQRPPRLQAGSGLDWGGQGGKGGRAQQEAEARGLESG